MYPPTLPVYGRLTVKTLRYLNSLFGKHKIKHNMYKFNSYITKSRTVNNYKRYFIYLQSTITVEILRRKKFL